MVRKARVTGFVEYREGDGSALTVPVGPCEVEQTDLDVTISWAEEDTHGSTAMPVDDFQRYVAEGKIVFDD
jgi:hypothetical protein